MLIALLQTKVILHLLNVGFFEKYKLSFQANYQCSDNLWTNLGKPAFINNGIWNNQNNTITLILDVSTIAEISWNPGIPPLATNLMLSSSFPGETATFSALWNDNQSLVNGWYIFSTNNTGQWINASRIPFNSNPDWGNVTMTLNKEVDKVIGFREYADISLNLWGRLRYTP